MSSMSFTKCCGEVPKAPPVAPLKTAASGGALAFGVKPGDQKVNTAKGQILQQTESKKEKEVALASQRKSDALKQQAVPSNLANDRKAFIPTRALTPVEFVDVKIVAPVTAAITSHKLLAAGAALAITALIANRAFGNTNDASIETPPTTPSSTDVSETVISENETFENLEFNIDSTPVEENKDSEEVISDDSEQSEQSDNLAEDLSASDAPIPPKATITPEIVLTPVASPTASEAAAPSPSLAPTASAKVSESASPLPSLKASLNVRYIPTSPTPYPSVSTKTQGVAEKSLEAQQNVAVRTWKDITHFFKDKLGAEQSDLLIWSCFTLTAAGIAIGLKYLGKKP